MVMSSVSTTKRNTYGSFPLLECIGGAIRDGFRPQKGPNKEDNSLKLLTMETLTGEASESQKTNKKLDKRVSVCQSVSHAISAAWNGLRKKSVPPIPSSVEAEENSSHVPQDLQPLNLTVTYMDPFHAGRAQPSCGIATASPRIINDSDMMLAAEFAIFALTQIGPELQGGQQLLSSFYAIKSAVTGNNPVSSKEPSALVDDYLINRSRTKSLLQKNIREIDSPWKEYSESTLKKLDLNLSKPLDEKTLKYLFSTLDHMIEQGYALTNNSYQEQGLSTDNLKNELLGNLKFVWSFNRAVIEKYIKNKWL